MPLTDKQVDQITGTPLRSTAEDADHVRMVKQRIRQLYERGRSRRPLRGRVSKLRDRIAALQTQLRAAEEREFAAGWSAAVDKIATHAYIRGITIEAVEGSCEDTVDNLIAAALSAPTQGEGITEESEAHRRLSLIRRLSSESSRLWRIMETTDKDTEEYRQAWRSRLNVCLQLSVAIDSHPDVFADLEKNIAAAARAKEPTHA